VTPAFRLLLPYPQFVAVGLSPDTPGSSSSYNAFLAKYEQRFKGGFNMMFTYQFSKAIDNVSETQGWEIKCYTRNMYDLSADRSISGHDMPRDFRGTILWELPFGRGKRFGSDMSRAMDAALGGWRVSSIIRLGDGLPLQWTASNSLSNYGFVVARPNITSLPDLASGAAGPDHWFNTAAVSKPAAYTIGTAPRYTGNIRTGAMNDTDFLVSKEWKLIEGMKLQFRAEAYNFTNTPMYGRANTTVGNSNFGKVTGTYNVGPRTLQMGMRLSF
jgi:hypothetical protein